VSAGLALALLALVVGLGLVVLEFLIPSFGMIGLTAAVCLAGSIVLAFTEHVGWGFAFMAAVLVGVPAMLGLGARVMEHSPIGRRLILGGPVTPVSGGAVPAERLARLAGQTGTALSMLRPSGVAQFGDERVDVVAEVDWIEPHTPIAVVRVEGFRVVVRPCTGGAPRAPAKETVDA
jgi:membrane-bound serine protease (ClpP class)